MGWWMLWGGFMMLVFWGGLALLIAWVVRIVAPGGADDPAAIARRRYARGEITQEQFLAISADLSRPAPPGRADGERTEG